MYRPDSNRLPPAAEPDRDVVPIGHTLVEALGIPVLSKPFNIESLKHFLAAASAPDSTRRAA